MKKARPSDESYLKLKTVAQMLDVDMWTIRLWLLRDENVFPGSFKTGPRRNSPWRIPKSAVDLFIAERQKKRKQVA